MTETLRYLFAVTREVPPQVLGDHVALGESPLRVIERHGLQAVVDDVPLAEYNEDALRQNLEDLAWVERVARAHDDVVRLMAGHGTVVPLRLVTIFADDESVQAALDKWQPQLDAALRRVAGRKEWSVKGYLRHLSRAESEQADTARPATPEPGAGAAYLARKRALVDDRRRADVEATELAEAVHVAMAGHAVATRRLAAQDPQLTGRSERMILNGAYLVAEDEEDRFLRGVQAVRERHPNVELEVAGPWAPYSFATLEKPDGG